MVRFDSRKIATLLLLLAAPAAQAQLWSGPAAVEVRVEDQKGLPVAGALLQLQYHALNPKDGPPAVLTDSRGKATVGGLAEGAWHLEVSREGFMTYLAEIVIREKGRVSLEEAAQFHVTGATRTMKVQISRGRSVPSAPAPVVAEKAPTTPAAVTSAPAPPAPVTPPAPRSENPPPPPEKPVAQPAPAPLPLPPASSAPPAPQPENPPAPEPPREKPAPAPTPVAPTPVPEPAAPPPLAPPAAPPPSAPPAAPPAPSAPAIAPTPPPAPPADPVRLRTSKDRTCFECPPGESALSTERVIATGNGPGCGANISAQLQDGNVPAVLPAGCHVLRLSLPAGMRYTGYRFEVQLGGDSLDCLAGQSCPQDTGRWPINPVLIRGPEGTVILAPFESGPAERERRAVFTAYFTAGTAKRPR